MKTKLLLLLLVMILPTTAFAQKKHDSYLGANVGYSGTYGTVYGAAYYSMGTTIFNRPAEIRMGLKQQGYQLDFAGIKDLDAMSVGIFGDAIIYPFNRGGFFLGLHWELLNFNWFTQKAKQKLLDEKNYDTNILYTGTNLLAQLGYKFKLTEHFGLVLQGQAGLHSYNVSAGGFTSGSYTISDSNSPVQAERHLKFVYNLNLGFVVKL
jgi:hypothetical protein